MSCVSNWQANLALGLVYLISLITGHLIYFYKQVKSRVSAATSKSFNLVLAGCSKEICGHKNKHRAKKGLSHNWHKTDQHI